MVMISKTVPVTINKNLDYWKAKGYSPGKNVMVAVEHLQSGARYIVECKCDRCGRLFNQRFDRNKDICYDPCQLEEKKTTMLNNKLGRANRGKLLPQNSGSNHWKHKKGPG